MKVPRYPTGYTRQYMSIQLIVDGCMHLYYCLFFIMFWQDKQQTWMDVLFELVP